jgi:hypothetical protein
MSKAEGREILSDAKKAGKEYARESVESEHFMNYVTDQVYSAPIEDLPETKKEAYRSARNMLIDLKGDMDRDLDFRDVIKKAGVGHTFTAYGEGYTQKIYGITSQDVYDAFWDGIQEVLGRKNMESWLGDEILFRSNERRGTLEGRKRHG